MSRYLDIARKGSCERAKRELSEPVATTPHVPTPLQPEATTNSPNSRFAASQKLSYQGVLAVLESRCPDHVDVARWQQCIADSRAFLAMWGEQAQALGWTSADLFGLHTPPVKPRSSYRRLSRYNQTGVIWLLEGRAVVALTADTATIKNEVTGTTTTYRRHHKPALGPLGDCLEDFVP